MNSRVKEKVAVSFGRCVCRISGNRRKPRSEGDLYRHGKRHPGNDPSRDAHSGWQSADGQLPRHNRDLHHRS